MTGTVLVTGIQQWLSPPRGILQHHREDSKGDKAIERVSIGELGNHRDGVDWIECGLGRYRWKVT